MTYSNGQGGSALCLDERKRRARAAALSVLAECDPASGAAVASQILANAPFPPGSVVAGFLPLGRELDLASLLETLRQAGHITALPRTPARGLALSFHRFAGADSLRRERFGTWTSDGTAVDPTVILVPLLAFDRSGHRLGYGGGYYDRTLAARPGIPTIGCAYAALERPEVPVGPADVALDAVATESEFITIKAHPCASFS